MEEHNKRILTGFCILLCVLITLINLPHLFPQLVTSNTPSQQLLELNNSGSHSAGISYGDYPDDFLTDVYVLDGDSGYCVSDVVVVGDLVCYSSDNLTVRFKDVNHNFRWGFFQGFANWGFTTSNGSGVVLVDDITAYLITLNPLSWKCHVNISGEFKGCGYTRDEWVIV